MRLACSCLACLVMLVSGWFIDECEAETRPGSNDVVCTERREGRQCCSSICRSGRHSLYQCLARILAHLLDLFAAPSRAHGPCVAVIVLLLLELDVRAVARYYDGAARLAAAQTRALQRRIRLGLVLLADGRARRGSRHVVGVRRPSDVVLSNRRVGCEGDLGWCGHFNGRDLWV
jgi:hypothetical protein